MKVCALARVAASWRSEVPKRLLNSNSPSFCLAFFCLYYGHQKRSQTFPKTKCKCGLDLFGCPSWYSNSPSLLSLDDMLTPLTPIHSASPRRLSWLHPSHCHRQCYPVNSGQRAPALAPQSLGELKAAAFVLCFEMRPNWAVVKTVRESCILRFSFAKAFAGLSRYAKVAFARLFWYISLSRRLSRPLNRPHPTSMILNFSASSSSSSNNSSSSSSSRSSSSSSSGSNSSNRRSSTPIWIYQGGWK